MREYIIKCYQEAVALSPFPQELKDSLRTAERIPTFLDNLQTELSKVPKISPDTIRTCVHDLTNILLSAVEKKATENQLSDIAKTTLATKNKMDELADRINSAPENAPAQIDMDEVI